MRYDNLLNPLSDEQPCGPDLEVEGDDGFIDYYYEALARVPERFVDTATGEIFDRTSVDLSAEVSQIGALLEQTIDIRLLVMEAKFQILAGKLEGFSDCMQIIAALLDQRWHDVHPQIMDGDNTERRNHIELLDDRTTVVMPLEHAPLFRDRRIDQITYRDFQVASGDKTAREGEQPPDAGSIQTALRSADNADAVDKVFAALTAAQESLNTISMRCKMADSGSFAPSLNNLSSVLDDMVAFIGDARPDLTGAEEDGDADSAETDGEGDAEAATPEAAPGAAPAAAAPPPGAVTHQEAARAALLAVETYFAQTEPSAPSLILIRQARLLIGRPLTEAIDTLLPDVADQARIDFGSESGFQMNIYKMRMLAEDTTAVDTLPAEVQEVPEYTANSRAEATNLIGAVETFFRQTEPSSPVPILLFKAKTYMNRDFSAIIDELFSHVVQ